LPEVSYTGSERVPQVLRVRVTYPDYVRSHLSGSVRLSLPLQRGREPRRPGMADRPKSAADVQAIVEDAGVRFVRLWFTDVLGQLKSFSINAAELEDAFDGGMGFDGSSIQGFKPIEGAELR